MTRVIDERDDVVCAKCAGLTFHTEPATHDYSFYRVVCDGCGQDVGPDTYGGGIQALRDGLLVVKRP